MARDPLSVLVQVAGPSAHYIGSVVFLGFYVESVVFLGLCIESVVF